MSKKRLYFEDFECPEPITLKCVNGHEITNCDLCNTPFSFSEVGYDICCCSEVEINGKIMHICESCWLDLPRKESGKMTKLVKWYIYDEIEPMHPIGEDTVPEGTSEEGVIERFLKEVPIYRQWKEHLFLKEVSENDKI